MASGGRDWKRDYEDSASHTIFDEFRGHKKQFCHRLRASGIDESEDTSSEFARPKHDSRGDKYPHGGRKATDSVSLSMSRSRNKHPFLESKDFTKSTTSQYGRRREYVRREYSFGDVMEAAGSTSPQSRFSRSRRHLDEMSYSDHSAAPSESRSSSAYSHSKSSNVTPLQRGGARDDSSRGIPFSQRKHNAPSKFPSTGDEDQVVSTKPFERKQHVRPGYFGESEERRKPAGRRHVDHSTELPRKSDSTEKRGQDRDKSWYENVQSFSPGEIMSLSRSRPEKLVNDLFGKIKKFQGTLQRRPLLDKPGIMDAIIIILAKIASTLTSFNHKASQILGEVLSERCATFQLCLKIYVSQDLSQTKTSHSRYQQKTVQEKVQNVSELFHHLFRSLPGSSWSSLPIDELHYTVEELITVGELTEDFSSSVQDILILSDAAREQHFKQLKQSNSEDGDWDNNEYRKVEILPEWEEVCIPKKPARLRKNVISGCYSDWPHYYDVQFRLLREDFIAPLRNGVCDYLAGKRGRKLKSVRIYENVLIKEPTFSSSGLCYKVKLDFSHMRRRCNWAHSKRLLHGSLLCLSPHHDDFKKQVYFATVTNRDPKKLEDGELEIMFQGDAEILSFSCKETPFIAVESCAYFEASRHILRSLQTAEVATMPFKPYLVQGDCGSVGQPQYLAENAATQYNLSFLLTEDEQLLRVSLSNSSIDDDYGFLKTKLLITKDECLLVDDLANFNQWPSCSETELDHSQMKGLQMALTQEIAVIQGPPGTGKTYIGLKIVEALLLNKKVWNTDGAKSPILIMCFTNHALDQFLEGILNCPIYKDRDISNVNVVRIGSRSQSEKLADFNLQSKKRNIFLPSDVLEEKFLSENAVKENTNKNSELLQKYYAVMRNCKHILLNDLDGIINPTHQSQLFYYCRSEEQQYLALEIWLCFYYIDLPYIKEAYSRMKELESQPIQEAVVPNDAEGAAEDDQNEHESESDNESLIDITGEAAIEQSDRILDEAYHHPTKEIEFTIASGDFKEYLASLRIQHYSAPATIAQSDTGAQFTRIPFSIDWAKIVIELGFTVEAMSEDEAAQIKNIHDLPFEARWSLYNFWRLQYLKNLSEKCEQAFAEYRRLCVIQDEARKKANRYSLETAEIIGMTTTGAAKYQHILHQVKPRIVIVEEAAEVLESHIVSALNAGTQHLILIGDHKQLRPKPNEYELAKKYNLDVSLFERLVRNGFPHATLEYQHRMRPEIAELVKPHIYQTLSNHQSVLEYPDVRGVSTNLFFINHSHEEKEDENLVSHSNAHEASFLVSLCQYLLRQCYTPQQITILVTYAGQLLAMRKLMPRNEFEGVRVSTVDNFQGEENDIILLSLVRSNSENKVGFLREENRVCVALSRARKGFYCIGNFTMLREQVPIWNTIMSDMESKGKLGDSLLLHCSNHPETSFRAKKSLDFVRNSPEGGCRIDCTCRLTCGHVCTRKCHYTDPEHANYACKKKCTKSCPEGHPCQRLCFVPCQCMVRISRVMPRCEHTQEMHCYEDPSKVNCINPCKEKCSKGHSCPFKCHEGCKQCEVTVSVTMPSCNHQQSIKCYQNPALVSCKADCSKRCENGHPCPKRCHEYCGLCPVPVTKVIPECNHEISLPCHVKPVHNECTEPCEQILPCGHKCKLRCGEDCLSEECTIQVTVELPACGHKVKVACYRSQDLSVIVCSKECERSLPCGHPCDQICSDPCTTECKIKVNKMWPCGHKLKKACYKTLNPESYPCKSECMKKLKCGHQCSKKCSEPCDDKCKKTVTRVYPCGHQNEVSCSSTPASSPCALLCSHILACGHKCGGKCSNCFTKHIHKPCDFKIEVRRFCGHTVQVPCIGWKDSHPGKKIFPLTCPHKTIKTPCSDDIHHTCDEPCEWSCKHFECDKTCSEICTRPKCDERCMMKLDCGHECYGLCGEPCLSFCPHCQYKKFMKKLKSAEHFNKAELYYQLDCGHIFPVKCLDEYVDKICNPESGQMLIHPLLCPEKQCSLPFSCGYRYGNQVKLLLTYTQDVKTTLRSTPFASDISEKKQQLEDSNILLQQNLNKIIESELYIEEPINNPRKGDFKKRAVIIKSDRVCVYYQPMPEISAALYRLKKRLPQEEQEMYLVLLFIEALNFLDKYVYSSKNHAILNEVKGFLKFINDKLFTDKFQFKLSYQILIDLKSAFLRLCLGILTELCSEDSPDASIVSAKSYLQETPTNSLVTESDFLMHLNSISEIYNISVDFRKLLIEINALCPDVYKGQWWRCGKGHYYCSPASLLDSIELKCPHCEGYEKHIKLPDQALLQVKLETITSGPGSVKDISTTKDSNDKQGAVGGAKALLPTPSLDPLVNVPPQAPALLHPNHNRQLPSQQLHPGSFVVGPPQTGVFQGQPPYPMHPGMLPPPPPQLGMYPALNPDPRTLQAHKGRGRGGGGGGWGKGSRGSRGSKSKKKKSRLV